MEEKQQKIDYVKPEILDLGSVTSALGGDCSGDGNNATGDCLTTGDAAVGICDFGSAPTG